MLKLIELLNEVSAWRAAGYIAGFICITGVVFNGIVEIIQAIRGDKIN